MFRRAKTPTWCSRITFHPYSGKNGRLRKCVCAVLETQVNLIFLSQCLSSDQLLYRDLRKRAIIFPVLLVWLICTQVGLIIQYAHVYVPDVQ